MLSERVAARLDARLQTKIDHPVALALSGGGDSMALLEIAAVWARRAGRRLLAITVDHGLNAEATAWNHVCAGAARSVGADWTLRHWEGDKPATGLPAAARRARHGLIADAAREAGAKVVLFAHTADDVAESDWMRARGSTLGTLREWGPSPAWPEGRGLMLFRPMLEERREDLREWLREGGRGWIEDPANGDERFGRSRARRALLPPAQAEGMRLADRSDAPAERLRRFTLSVSHLNPLPFRARTDRLTAPGRSSPLPLGEGMKAARDLSRSELAAVLVCVSGGDTPPRAARLEATLRRLQTSENFTATLSGTHIRATGDTVFIGREPGELRRHPVPDIALNPNRPHVWDGRYEITAHAPGWTVTAALGRLNHLSDPDRVIVKTVAARARGALPVLIRDAGDAPVLAWRAAQVRSLAARRLSLALGETTQESDLHGTIHSETPPPDLF